MPGGDRTGPNGLGPMTGRRAGYCAGSNVSGFENRFDNRRGGFGRGYGRRFRGGYGGNEFYPTQDYAEVSEKTILENDIRVLKEQLNSLEKRLSETTKKKEE